MSSIRICTEQPLFETAPDFYGLFFEDINRSGDGGLYPEMLRNRAFEDSILPERCKPLDGTYGFVTPEGWRDQFNNGEGLKRWMDGIEETPVPAWYARDAGMSLDFHDTLNKNRLASLTIDFEPGGYVTNIGFRGLSLVQGQHYEFYMFARGNVSLTVSLESKDRHVYAAKTLDITGTGYQRYDLTLCPDRTDPDARFTLESRAGGSLNLGFTSLMPRDTYKGHGMRKDLMEMLHNTHSGFLRFPGGCIVEGFTRETAVRFPHMIGPVWERPSHNLMWHYRTTNGLGYHEYLQICEDLDLEPMYVINCGITCQGRKPELFEGEELEQWIQEAFDAIDYAIAPADSRWGSLRAQAGHPQPFKLTYLEIGNENDKDVYFSRYEKFYHAIHEKYPQLKLISNTHTENRGLPTQIVDEHLYSTADTFVTVAKKYRNYDRSGPQIFIGEYAVTSGLDIGNLKSALAETMYLMEAEKNQDLVRLTAYAPLFQNVDYTAWYPNLIAFNNHACFGIPFYHALAMLARSHGRSLLKTEADVRSGYPEPEGLNGLIAYQPGIFVKNVHVNGKTAAFSHGIIGSVQSHGNGILELTSDYIDELEGYPNTGHIPMHTAFVTFGDTEESSSTFELEVLLQSPEQEIDLAVWVHSTPMLFSRDETNPFYTSWNPIYTDRYVWSIKQGTGRFASVNRFNYSYFGTECRLPIRYGEYNRFQVKTRHGGFDCYLNGRLVQTASMVPYPMVAELASEDDTYIYVKIVNIDKTEEAVEICLDCEIDAEYEAELLTGHPKDTNSLDEPEKVCPISRTFSNGSGAFTYLAPAYSFTVLKLRKAVLGSGRESIS